jgi:hypothetical protein
MKMVLDFGDFEKIYEGERKELVFRDFESLAERLKGWDGTVAFANPESGRTCIRKCERVVLRRGDRIEPPKTAKTLEDR